MIKVLVIGAGAIGGFYGALLARQGAEVAVVCRSEYEHIKAHGFQINSHELGNWNFKPASVLNKVDDYQDQADYVILCTKIIEQLDRVALVRPAISNNTTVVFIQNGIEIESELLLAFPEHEVVSGVAYICCNRTGLGVISHIDYGRLTLGSPGKNPGVKTQRLVALFQQAGIECQATANIAQARWQKCVWNAPFSPLSVLSGGLSTKQILATQEPLVRNIMAEVCAIATATSNLLSATIIDSNITNTYLMPPYKTSMLLDYEAGRPMETEAILGNTVRVSQKYGVKCPYLESLYALMKLREQALRVLIKES